MEPEVNTYPELTVAEITKKLFNRKFLSDIQFQVGDQIIYAHSLTLMMRSPVFEKQLKATSRDNKLIPMIDVKYESFYQFLRFIYSDECTVTDEIAIELIKLAKKYKIMKLENFVFASDQGHDFYLNLLEYCLLENDTIRLRKIQIFIIYNLKEIMKWNRFLTLQPFVIEKILNFKFTTVTEFELFEGLSRWIQCNSKANQIEAAQQPSHYGNLIRLIRFPVMTVDEIYTCTTDHPHMFMESDFRSLFKIVAKPADQENSVWHAQPRENFKYDFLLAKYSKNEGIETKFSVSRALIFNGIVFGIEKNDADAKIKISQRQCEAGETENFVINWSQSTPSIYNMINLGESIRLQPNWEYTIEIEYCATTEVTEVVYRKETTNLFTNISPDLVKFDKVGRNVMELYFALPKD